MGVIKFLTRKSHHKNRNYYFLNWGVVYILLSASIAYIEQGFSFWAFCFASVGGLTLAAVFVRNFKFVAIVFALLSALAFMRGMAYLTPLFTVTDSPLVYGAGVMYLGVGFNHLIASGVKAAEKPKMGEDATQ